MAIVRQRNRPKKPPHDRRMVISPVGFKKEKPDTYSSLTKWLEATGRVKHLTYAQQMRARHLYLQGKSVEIICNETGYEPAIIERLALVNGWDEERDKRLFHAFRRINNLGNQLAPNIDQRHDRIAGTIETVAERVLQSNSNGELDLTVTDLKRLADTLKTTVEIRRTLRGKITRHSEQEVNVQHHIPDSTETERLADALKYSIENKDRQVARNGREKQKLEISVGESIGCDEEFESDS